MGNSGCAPDLHPDQPGSWGAAQEGTASPAALKTKTAVKCAAANPPAAAAAGLAAGLAAAAEARAAEARAVGAAAAGLPVVDLVVGAVDPAAGAVDPAAGAAAVGAAVDPAAVAPAGAAALFAASPRLSATPNEELAPLLRQSQGKPPSAPGGDPWSPGPAAPPKTVSCLSCYLQRRVVLQRLPALEF